MKFVRLGGLSPVKYKAVPGSFEGHVPPARHGIFAFPWPYIEAYLCLYDNAHQAELKLRGFRHFEFDGYLYHHLKGGDLGWSYDDTEEYDVMLKAFKHNGIKELHADKYIANPTTPIHDPFKRGLGGWFSRDSLEVFIAKSDMGRIR